MVDADNPAYIILAVLIFLSAVVLKEEAIILAFEDKTVILERLDRKKSKELLKIFERHLKRKHKTKRQIYSAIIISGLRQPPSHGLLRSYHNFS